MAALFSVLTALMFLTFFEHLHYFLFSLRFLPAFSPSTIICARRASHICWLSVGERPGRVPLFGKRQVFANAFGNFTPCIISGHQPVRICKSDPMFSAPRPFGYTAVFCNWLIIHRQARRYLIRTRIFLLLYFNQNGEYSCRPVSVRWVDEGWKKNRPPGT